MEEEEGTLGGCSRVECRPRWSTIKPYAWEKYNVQMSQLLLVNSMMLKMPQSKKKLGTQLKMGCYITLLGHSVVKSPNINQGEHRSCRYRHMFLITKE